MKIWCVVVLWVIASCGSRQSGLKVQTPNITPGSYRVWIKGATIASRRPDGSPWHRTEADNTSTVIGAAAGLALGNPELGASIGGAFAEKGGEPEAPLAYVAIKIAGETETIAPVARSYSPTWEQSIVINTVATSVDELVVIQVLDAVDGGLLGQTEMHVADLVGQHGRTMTTLRGSVASLDIETSYEPEPVDRGVPEGE
jgi:hypothetical protein